MTTPNQESLRDLSREELVELILEQAEAIRQMQTEIERLKKPTAAATSCAFPTRSATCKN